MKILALLALVGTFLSSTVASYSASPLLRYEFNQPGATQYSTGSEALALSLYNYNQQLTDYITTTPVQRAGADTNYALNFSAANVDAGLPSGQQVKGSAEVALNNSNAAFLRGELESFTISTWLFDVKAENTTSATRRLFSLRNSSGQQIIDLRLYNTPGSSINEIHFGVHGEQGSALFKTTTLSVPVDDENWFFLAISYDATTGLLTFYGGEEGGTLVSETAWNIGEGGVNTLLTNANLLGIGNVGYQHQRRMDGYLSDFQFYGEALSAAEVQALYAIPEPSTLALLGSAVFFGAVRHLRRRNGRP